MNKDILNNLNFFSDFTQRTLSAFHYSGIESSLSDDIADIKRIISKSTKKKILRVEELGDKYKRIFTDESFDIVDEKGLMKEAYYENKGYYDVIERALSREINPILSIKMGSSIIMVNDKEIVSSSEKIFFL